MRCSIQLQIFSLEQDTRIQKGYMLYFIQYERRFGTQQKINTNENVLSSKNQIYLKEIFNEFHLKYIRNGYRLIIKHIIIACCKLK